MWAWVSLLPWSEVPRQGAISQLGEAASAVELLSHEDGLWGWPLLSMQCPGSLRALSRSRILQGALTSCTPALAGGTVTDPGLRRCQKGGFCAIRLYLEILPELVCGQACKTVPAVE